MARHIGRCTARHFPPCSAMPCAPSNCAGPRHSAAMSSAATPAAISASRTTPAATGIARSASRWHAPSGWQTGRRNCSTVPYFHVVFTVPDEVAVIAFQNKPLVYDILFRAAAETLRRIAADPTHLGAEIGFLAVLHTWGQNLLHHPHLHCLVPGGGISPDGTRWIACRPGFFLPVRVLSRLFRGLFLHELEKAFTAGQLRFFSSLQQLQERSAFLRHLAPARRAEWVVFAKKPFAGPRAGARLCRALHPPHRHLQQPPARNRRRQGPLPLEGLPARQPPRRDDASPPTSSFAAS